MKINSSYFVVVTYYKSDALERKKKKNGLMNFCLMLSNLIKESDRKLKELKNTVYFYQIFYQNQTIKENKYVYCEFVYQDLLCFVFSFYLALKFLFR